MKDLAIKIIKGYQYFSRNIIGYNSIPLLFQSQCRYYPTCSDYAISSINQYGFWRGSVKGLVRIIKCNPLHS